MFRIESWKQASGAAELPADVVGFIAGLNRCGEGYAGAERFFAVESDLVVTRSPGRLDVMGGIADYSGSLVLQLPTLESTLVALQRDRSRMIRVTSLAAGAEGDVLRFDLPIEDLDDGGEPASYDKARALFAGGPERRWASYAVGAFPILMRERNIRFSEGARILVASNLPQGRGVSSSAAIEVAVMQAIAAAFELDIDPIGLALLCQRVENSVAGAPCGIMDQMTAVCGEAEKLLALLCQPAELQGTISIPDGMSIWGLDSGVPHSVSGDEYSSVRVGTFMGYRMIAEKAGLAVDDRSSEGTVTITDPKWRGYLANISPSEFEEQYAASLPEVMSGSNFISKYQGTTDSVTKIDPQRLYHVRTATAHPVYEHFRVRRFAELLEGSVDDKVLEELGELMYQSNASYSACGLGSRGTDLLIDLVKRSGPRSGLYGARVTGGGSGGTVAVLGRSSGEGAIQDVADKYAEKTGYKPYIFRGSSCGASKFGHLRVAAAV